MLEPKEYFVGNLTAAPAGSLVLPRNQHELPVLMGLRGEGRIGVFLGEPFRFSTLENDNFDDWAGLIVPGVTILADESTLTPEIKRLGTLVRLKDKIALAASPPVRHGFGQMIRVDLATDLPPCADTEQAGFLHWQIVLGRGVERRVLFNVDLREIDQQG